VFVSVGDTVRRNGVHCIVKHPVRYETDMLCKSILERVQSRDVQLSRIFWGMLHMFVSTGWTVCHGGMYRNNEYPVWHEPNMRFKSILGRIQSRDVEFSRFFRGMLHMFVSVEYTVRRICLYRTIGYRACCEPDMLCKSVFVRIQ
jgi:hypothetical protein